MTLSNQTRFQILVLGLAPCFSLVLPFIYASLDKTSKCHLVPIFNETQIIPFILIGFYFGIPIIAGLYGISLKSEWTKNGQKLSRLSFLVALNLIFPIILVLWSWIVFVSLFGPDSCYQLELNVIF